MGDINKMEEELSDIDAGELLKGLQSLGESDNQ